MSMNSDKDYGSPAVDQILRLKDQLFLQLSSKISKQGHLLLDL